MNSELTKLRILSERAKKKYNEYYLAYRAAQSAYISKCKELNICPSCSKNRFKCKCVAFSGDISGAFTDSFSSDSGEDINNNTVAGAWSDVSVSPKD